MRRLDIVKVVGAPKCLEYVRRFVGSAGVVMHMAADGRVIVKIEGERELFHVRELELVPDVHMVAEARSR